MPAHVFQLSRPSVDGTATASKEALPRYSTRDSRLPAYLQPHEKETSAYVDVKDVPHQCATESTASMIPQALLVDAATTLCAYLYYTSLQARLALQQNASLDLLSSVCSSLPEDADHALLHTCAHAISHQSDSMAVIQSGLSHHGAIALVVVKAIVGLLLLTRGAAYVRPFDYLVASGALHCILLYAIFFVPVASLVIGAGISNAQLWLRVTTKMLYLVAFCTFGAVTQWLVRSRRQHSDEGKTLSTDALDDDISHTSIRLD